MAKINWQLQVLRFFQSAYRQGMFHKMSNEVFQTVSLNIMKNGGIKDSSQWFLHCNELHYRKGKSWFDYDSPSVVLSNSLVFANFIANRDVVNPPPFKFSMYRTERNILYCGQKILARFINGVLLVNETIKQSTLNTIMYTVPKDVNVSIVSDEHLKFNKKDVLV